MDLAALILPALVAGVAVWFAAFLIWMVSGLHTKDIQSLSDEQQFMDDLKRHDLPPGLYMWPNCQDRADLNSDDFKARWKAGPWGTINILGGQPNFLRNLVGTLVLYCLIALGIAAAISMVLGGVNGADVLVTCTWCQIFAPAAILAGTAYVLGPICGDLFLGKQTRFIITQSIGGVIYALVTALLLTLMWPV